MWFKNEIASLKWAKDKLNDDLDAKHFIFIIHFIIIFLG